MSGAEALALVGGVAAVVQIAGSLNGVVSRIRTGTSEGDLNIDVESIKRLADAHRELKEAIAKSQDPGSSSLAATADSVLVELEGFAKIVEKYKSPQDGSNVKLKRAFHEFRRPAQQKIIRHALDRLQFLLINMVALQSSIQETRRQLLLLPVSSDDAHITVRCPSEVIEPAPAGPLVATSTAVTTAPPFVPPYRSSKRSACSRGICTCRCHQMDLGRFYNSWIYGSHWRSVLYWCSCPSKRFNWTLNAFQKRVTFGLALRYEDGLRLEISLPTIENTVPDTAPMFLILQKCKLRISSLKEAIEDLKEILSARTGSFNDRNRSGQTWLDAWFNVMQSCSRSPRVHKMMIGVLDFVIAQGADLKSSCLWNDVAKALHEDEVQCTVLRRLMSSVRPLRIEQDVDMESSGYRRLSLGVNTRDPFGLKTVANFLTLCSTNYGGTGCLTYAILLQSATDIKPLLGSPMRSKLLHETNFLGQSPLHAAILRSDVLRTLMDHGFESRIDDTDVRGRTALVYAARYGQPDSVRVLLDAGADHSCKDKLGLTCLDYATLNHQFDVVTSILDHFDNDHSAIRRQAVLDEILQAFLQRASRQPGDNFLRELLELGPTLEWCDLDGNTVMHLAKSAEEADALLDSGFNIFNQANRRGKTVLMKVVRFGSPLLVKRLIELGSDVHARDDKGRNALWHAVSRKLFDSYNSPALKKRFSIAALLLEADAGVRYETNERCPCSIDGSSPIVSWFRWPRQFHWMSSGSFTRCVWLLEWYLLLRTKLGVEDLALNVRSIFRLHRFDELGLRHMNRCAMGESNHLLSYNALSRNGNDGEDPADDQKRFVQSLDEDCYSILAKLGRREISAREALLSTLARRVVFLERGKARYQVEDRVNSKRTPKNALILKRRSDGYSIWVDTNEDRIISSTEIVRRVVEPYVTSYLTSARSLEYRFQTGDSGPNVSTDALQAEREAMCAELLERVQVLRQMTDEELDWDLDTFNVSVHLR